MLQRYVSGTSVLLVFLLNGCASTPVEQPAHMETALETVLPQKVSDIEDEYQAALSLMKEENWQAAADKLAAITVTAPDLSGPWTNLGISRVRLGDPSGAEQAFRAALAANPGQVVAYNELGLICRRSGRLGEAAALYNEGLKINPNAEDIHWNLGILYDRYLPNPAQALVHYERYRQLTQSQDSQLLGWIDELREQSSQMNVASGAKQ